MHTIMSFDVDRTLVDRNKSCHQLTPQVREALLQAAETPGVAVILNTGRDLGALR
jgi:HAD superfamily hydrolase (TIGR01484 family)